MTNTLKQIRSATLKQIRSAHTRKPYASALALAITAASLSLGTVALPASAAETAPASQTPTSQLNFDIASGPMATVLNRFASAAGITLSFDPAAVEGISSNGVQGSYTVDDALRSVLSGTGLQLNRTGSGGYLVAKPTAVNMLPAVKVTSDVLQDGSAEAGYVSTSVSQVGPWQGRSLQDTPYSINVVSKELIENLQATTTDQVFKIAPTVQVTWPQMKNDNAEVQMRGFAVTSFARDGVSRQGRNYSYGTTMEEFERVEILTGLSGFIYGAGHVGGTMNFITKRSTDKRFNSITLGNAGGENLYIHGDFGGQFDAGGRFGYRINAVTQEGETNVDDQDLERQFISGAFDWQLTDNLLVEINGSSRDYRLSGRQPFWLVWDSAVEPADADDIDVTETWGQKWSFHDVESKRLGVNIDWQLSDSLSLRAGYLTESNTQTYALPWNIFGADNTYDLFMIVRKNAPLKISGDGIFLFADYDFSLGATQHQLTVGVQNNESIWREYMDPEVYPYFGGLSLDEPTDIKQPVFEPHGTMSTYHKHDQRTRTYTVGDDITFNEQWSALIGLTHSQIIHKNNSAPGVRAGDYDKGQITPTVSLIYTPEAIITTYISYMEALEQGGVADATFGPLPVLNANDVMEPLVSKQIEMGAKTNIGGVLMTAALFNIDKPLEYYEIQNGAEARFVQDGRQVHSGLEMTATGRITDNLVIVGGFSLLKAEIEENEENPELEGKRPINVAERMAKLYVEYSLPSVEGLILNGGIIYTGDRFSDQLNIDKVNGYTVADIGARYVMDMDHKTLTLRVNINNVTDERYWANVDFANNGLLGDPRTVIFSANLTF